MKIAIIGGGLSGVLTAIYLLRKAVSSTTIYLIEQHKHQLGRGVAYASTLEYQPLNVPAAAMSLFEEQPNDFVAWLSSHQRAYTTQLTFPLNPQDFVPRCIFGDYLQARLQEAVGKAAKGVELISLVGEVCSAKRQEEGNPFLLTLGGGHSIWANKVVLALGNLAPAPIPLADPSFYQSSAYAASPWCAEALAGLPVTAPVLLIGSSLTMVDLVGSLWARKHQGKICVVSRHGLLPQPYDVNAVPYSRLPIPVQVRTSALELFRFIRCEIRKAEAKGYSWHSVLDALRDEIPAIWQAFSLQEKKRFMRHIRPYWEVHRHRMPERSAALLEELQASGQLHVMAATVVALQQHGTAVQVTLRKRKREETIHLSVDSVINCTGPQSDLTKVDMPLVQQLLADRMMTPDALRLGVLTSPQGVLLGEQAAPVTGLYTLGPLRKATWYESTALREIRRQAGTLTNELLQQEQIEQEVGEVA